MFRDVSSGVVRWQDTKRGESHLTQMQVAELLQTTQAVYESIQTLSKKTANVYGTTRIMFERGSSKKRIIKKIAEGVSGRSDSSMQHLKNPLWTSLSVCTGLLSWWNKNGPPQNLKVNITYAVTSSFGFIGAKRFSTNRKKTVLHQRYARVLPPGHRMQHAEAPEDILTLYWLHSSFVCAAVQLHVLHFWRPFFPSVHHGERLTSHDSRSR